MTTEQILAELDDIYKLIRPKSKFAQSGEDEVDEPKSQFIKSFDHHKEDFVLNQKRYRILNTVIL